MASKAELDSPLWTPPSTYPPRSVWSTACSGCGACCAAPDISALHKPLGEACRHLDPSCRCAVYASRPAVCRNYTPDWVCGEVAPLPDLTRRVQRFLDIYGLSCEAGRAKST